MFCGLFSVLQKLVGSQHHYSSGTHLGLEVLCKPCMNVSRIMIEAMYMGIYFHEQFILKFYKWHWSYICGTIGGLKRSPSIFSPSTHWLIF